MPKELQIRKIAAVGDIHVKEDDRGKWVDYFRKVSEEADILLLCGDVTDTGHIAEAEILAKELRSCTIPVIGILGNHDYERGMHKEVKKILENDRIFFLDGQAKVIEGVGFAGVKGFGGGFGGSGRRDSSRSRPSTNGSGRSYRFLTPAERLPDGLPGLFTSKDRDRDGQVTMAEFARTWTEETFAEFNRWDLNRDGWITASECLTAENGRR